MKELNIRLTIDQLNIILEALGQQSYIKVYELIDNIQTQAKGQLNGSPSNGSINNEHSERGIEVVSN